MDSVAQQPSDDECGYYAILSVWALALGLHMNPNVRLPLDEAFFDDLLDVIHLARIGRADYRLIYVFLRCRDFVTAASNVALDRQFEKLSIFLTRLCSLLTLLRCLSGKTEGGKRRLSICKESTS
jgi:hypothetical protein